MSKRSVSHSTIRAGSSSTYGRCGAERRAGLVRQGEGAAQRGRRRLNERVGSWVSFRKREPKKAN